MINKGILVVISAPSGSGKGTIIKRLIEMDSNFRLSISATTRQARKGETHGKEYYFLSKAEFIQLMSDGGMLEYAEYCGNYYGTPSDVVDDWIDKGRDVILEVEVKGGSQIRKKRPNSVSIFILPPSLTALEARLRGRGTETSEVINKRLFASIQEIAEAVKYDYIVVNDSLEKCVDDIRTIINAEKMNSSRNINLIKEVLESD